MADLCGESWWSVCVGLPIFISFSHLNKGDFYMVGCGVLVSMELHCFLIFQTYTKAEVCLVGAGAVMHKVLFSFFIFCSLDEVGVHYVWLYTSLFNLLSCQVTQFYLPSREAILFCFTTLAMENGVT